MSSEAASTGPPETSAAEDAAKPLLLELGP
jgi:hypothetical protein